MQLIQPFLAFSLLSLWPFWVKTLEYVWHDSE
jgi:hypothetical protein